MLRRRSAANNRGPGLVSTVARTAVIAGTATATSNKVNARHQQKQQAAATQAAEQQGVADLQQQVSQLQVQHLQGQLAGNSGNSGNSSNSGGDLVGQLAQLAQLREAGALSDDEFNAAKQRLLGS